jgi:hypothetical protein
LAADRLLIELSHCPRRWISQNKRPFLYGQPGKIMDGIKPTKLYAPIE